MYIWKYLRRNLKEKKKSDIFALSFCLKRLEAVQNLHECPEIPRAK